MREYPISQQVRELANGRGKNKDAARPVDSALVWRSKSILSFAMDYDELVQAAIQVHTMMGNDGGSASERWPRLMNAIVFDIITPSTTMTTTIG
jgi:hypothetical protein